MRRKEDWESKFLSQCEIDVLVKNLNEFKSILKNVNIDINEYSIEDLHYISKNMERRLND